MRSLPNPSSLHSVAILCAFLSPLLNPIPAALQAAVAIDEPKFLAAEPNDARELQLVLSTPPGSLFQIQSSSNLIQWSTLHSLEEGQLEFLDSSTPFLQRRYYRLASNLDAVPLSGDHFATGSGDAVVHPVNHASFVIRWNGLMIYNDPVGNASLYAAFPKADLILVSHTHGDHFSASTLAAVLKNGGTIVAPAAVWSSLNSALQSRTISLANGRSTNILGTQIEAVPAYNANHPKGVGNGYVLTLGNKRFYMSGDTEDVAEMRALKNIDAAFLCMNIPFTMTVQKAASAIRDFKPAVVYPYHYRNSDGTFADLNLLKRSVGSNTNKVEVRIRNWY